MITFAPFSAEPRPSSRRRKAVDQPEQAVHAATISPQQQRSRGRKAVNLAWLPLALLTPAAVILTADTPPWLRMWLIAIALFAGFKWWTLQRALVTNSPLVPKLTALRRSLGTSPAPREISFRANFRSLTYLCLWPGTSARAFLNTDTHPPRPTAKQWTWALGKTLLGALLLWCAARLAGNTLTAGWIGMIGFIFLLHFGLFALLSLFWQSRDIDAPPLMKCPIAASSLHDFWGRRWNAGFRDIVFPLFFFPLARRFGATIGALLTFVLSGLIHELVITVPAGAGYGLPTLYFTLQGLGLMLERKFVAARVSAWPARLFAWTIVVLPIGALFPPVFVERVMIPFFHLLHAL